MRQRNGPSVERLTSSKGVKRRIKWPESRAQRSNDENGVRERTEALDIFLHGCHPKAIRIRYGAQCTDTCFLAGGSRTRANVSSAGGCDTRGRPAADNGYNTVRGGGNRITKMLEWWSEITATRASRHGTGGVTLVGGCGGNGLVEVGSPVVKKIKKEQTGTHRSFPT